jgi:glycosyltransferase involved in cell wall biosynthesis
VIELFFLSHNRREFTEAALAAMLANTAWENVSSLALYDDRSKDGTADVIDAFAKTSPVQTNVRHVRLGGPVACMNNFIALRNPDLFCKIDSDTMLPPGWLEDCLRVMHLNPGVDLLGIEAMRPVAAAPAPREADPASHIGGIGLMRGRAFAKSLPRPDGRFGFTGWQEHYDVSAAWLSPSLPVFLLDRLPFEPWASLSREYVAKGWQRPWGPYSEKSNDLWGWWRQ